MAGLFLGRPAPQPWAMSIEQGRNFISLWEGPILLLRLGWAPQWWSEPQMLARKEVKFAEQSDSIRTSMIPWALYAHCSPPPSKSIWKSYTYDQGCNLWRNWVKLPPFCSQPVAALAGCQQRPERWRTEVLDFCNGSHKSSSFTPWKSRTSNNPVPVLRILSKYGWMSCSLNEMNQLRHKLQPCLRP